jgi:thioesterase domain-containing protein
VALPEMAKRYVEEIRQVVPNDPYLLAGHCSGAAVAFEIAQQLRAAGSTVGLLAVLDYTFFDTSEQRPAVRAWNFLRNLPLWLSDDLLRVGWRTAMGRFSSHLRVWSNRARNAFSRRPAVAADIRDRLGMWRFPEHQAAALEQAYRTFQVYRPSPYPGDVLLVTPRALPVFGARQADDLGWSRVVEGDLRRATIKGSHETMLNEPFVAELANVLRAEADRAIAKLRERPR